ncbi:MAG: hypothetical protein N2748_01175 [candidate division WOR-3 bacterium]|nr:hypothetical protein [candidate division WOR-3 bacterium]
MKYHFWHKLFGIKPKISFSPKRLGPTFNVIDNQLQIYDGPLAGSVFELEQEITESQMRLFLKQNNTIVGRALADRNPRTGEVTYWDVMVAEHLRMKGLASVMTKYLIRELLFIQKKFQFLIRMIKLFRPTDTTIKLQNVGIGVIAQRLGLLCEFNLPKVLNPANIQKIEVLPPDGIFPPSYKIVLHTYPYVLIGFIVDPKTQKPISEYETYIKMIENKEIVEEWIANKTIVIGNGNYILKKTSVEQFVNCLANNEREANSFYAKII